MEFYQKILLNPVVSAFPFNIHATRSPINFLLSVSFFDRIRVHWFWLDCQQANKCKSECKINEIIDNFAFIFFLLTTQQSPFLPFFIHCSSSTFPFLSSFLLLLFFPIVLVPNTIQNPIPHRTKVRLRVLTRIQYFIHDPYFCLEAHQIQYYEHISRKTEQNKQKSGVLGGLPANYSSKPISLRF